MHQGRGIGEQLTNGVRFPAMLGAAALFAEVAGAEEKVWLSADFAATSSLFDRGEQIGGPTLEFGATAETTVSGATVYAAFYRLLPVGPDQEAFDDEADYTAGLVLENDTVVADLSANWLTYPGEGAEASLELVGAFDFNAPYAPNITGFYDADFEDWGVEVSAGPSWDVGGWTSYALGRAGFVVPGDGSANRSYLGAEIGASRPVSDNVEFGIFARAEAADAESYADEIRNGAVTRFRDSGIAVGMTLSVSG
ncbi:hypothetical protein [Henriciella mobilis]|nr:hypothetical protein [Henriciella mobilis]